MTREEAIKQLELTSWAQRENGNNYLADALDIAIKVLEHPELNMIEVVPCGDAISRKAVDKLSKDLINITKNKPDYVCKFRIGLRKLPSVEPIESEER